MDNRRLTYLFYRQLSKMNSGPESEELIHLMALPENLEQTNELVDEALESFEPEFAPFTQKNSEGIFQKILAATEKSNAINTTGKVYQMNSARFKWGKIAAAIIIIFFAGVSIRLLFQNKQKDLTLVKSESQNIKRNQLSNDVIPGGNKAVLILGDGSKIVLDSSENGSLAQQDNVKVTKLSDGELSYNISGVSTAEIFYNTVATPKGGQYKVVLSDGTLVWLNAASSIKYPTVFKGESRKVEITGEVYFEIAHLNRKSGVGSVPFTVEVNKVTGDGGTIEVLGTHFNVNAYPDELSVSTTLVEGSVKVTSKMATAFLKPGEQSRLNKAGNIDLIKNVNIEVALAWKNGKFQFNDASLEMVMRQLMRWYDVQVQYEGKVPLQRFGGEVSRNSKLSEVLRILEYSGVKLSISDNKIIVGQ